MADVDAAAPRNTDDHNNDNNDETDEQRRIRLRQEAMERLLLQEEEEETTDTNNANVNDDDNAQMNAPLVGGNNVDNNHPLAPDGNDDGRNDNNNMGAIPPMHHHNNNNNNNAHSSPILPKLSYTTSSFLAAAATLIYALRTRGQWYLALVYLSSSKWAFCILGNALVALAVQAFTLTTVTFLPGGLRRHEAEGLQDFFRWNVTETCLALTMFRSELSVGTACEFLALILVKCLHHVAVLRQNHLRMTDDAVVASSWNPMVPSIPWHHLRVLLFWMLLQLLDMWALQYTAQILMDTGPSVSVLFAFEAAILLVSAWSHLLLWNLHVLDGLLHFSHDLGSDWGRSWLHLWKEHKATLTFAVELQAQAVQFVFYLCFFGFVLVNNGMPINLFREVYVSFAALKERLLAFFKYRRLMAGMNRFQTPTDEEIEEAGRVCIICRDEMTVHDCKQLPGCGHMFHKSCLREWLTQQQSCPTCRADIYSNQAQETNRQAAAQAAADRQGDNEEEEEEEEEINNDNGETNDSESNNETTTTNAAQQESTNNEATPMTPEQQTRRSPTSTAAGQHQTAEGSNVEATPRTALAPPHEKAAALAEKTVRFAEPPPLPFPALYRVVCARGATVWYFDDDDDDAPLVPQPSTAPHVIRVIPLSVVVLGDKEQEFILPNGRRGLFVKVPDGWVAEDEILRVFNLS